MTATGARAVGAPAIDGVGSAPRTREQIRGLFVEFRAETADTPRRRALRDRLVELNTPLALYLVRRYRNTAEPFEDVSQVGMVGLIKAVDRFEPDRGLEFSTFAVPTILGEIRRYFRDATWAVHVPRGARELYSTVSASIPELSQKLGRAPTVPELAQRFGVEADRVVEALEAGAGYTSRSLQSLADPDSGEYRTVNLGAEDSRLEQAEQRSDLRPALGTLTERQRETLVLRFVYDKSQNQIAALLGVSQMQVSRLISRSLQQLRQQLEKPPAVPAA